MVSRNNKGFTLIEVTVGVAIFLLFTLGIYSTLSFVFKGVYQARTLTLESSILDGQLEIVRNLPYANVGEVGGVPSGVIPHTQSIAKNGVIFMITSTIRNIDDPFDGTVGGTPNDTSPADYKLVDMSILCTSCNQQQPLTLSTRVGPKGLEGASQNGALFINVFDANGLPVVGANVHVVNSSTNPATVVDDVTDNQGNVHIIDAPTGTMAYQMSVSKSNYSSDYSVFSSVDNPNPTTPPANIVSQTVTNVSFSIDHTGTISYHTLDNACVAEAGRSFTVSGSKLIGRNPDIAKYSKTLVSDGAGNYVVSPAEWDGAYSVSVTGTGYDLAGSIPVLPFKLSPSANQDVTLILTPHVSNSLLVTVLDAGTGLPLSGATINLSDVSYNETGVTGLGYSRQTDWSGGSGQAQYIDQSKYFSDDGGLTVNNSSGDVHLKKVGQTYVASGWLESSTFDLGTAVNFTGLVVTPLSQPTSTGSNSVLLQLATSNSSTPANWDFLGPDGTSASYYSATSTLVNVVHNGNQYIRYRLFLQTNDTHTTPQVGEIAITYTTGCTPPGQSFFGTIGSGTYTMQITRSGYTTASDLIDVLGMTQATVSMSPQ